MKLLKSNLVLLLIIVLFGLGLRTYKLDSVPPGLTWDEAALGYNAFSILKTGRDEHGNFLPLTLKSFGDYKPAVYAYLDIPFVALLGLNEWAVRLPSVAGGIGFIILTFLIVKEIFKSKWLGLSSAFFASISPLSIQFSRAAYESNIAVFLNVLGLYFFLRGLKSAKYFYGTAIALVLSMVCYQASKLFVPILLIGLFLLFRKKVKKSRELLVSLSILIIGTGIVYVSTFLFGQADRLAAQNLFAYKRTDTEIQTILKEDGLTQGSLEFGFFHGEWFKFISGILERYLTYFSPHVLFIEGDYSPRHGVPGLGVLNYYGLFLIPFGFYLLWRKRESEKSIILFWLFTASIPAVLSRDLISMVRALNLMLPFVILEGFGLTFLAIKVSSFTKIKNYLVLPVLLVPVFLNLVYYLDFYFVHFPKENSQGWLYGYKQVIAKLPDISKYDRVVFSDKNGQPYIYYLFYKQYPPEKFQSQAVLEQKSVDVGTVRKIDNIEFRSIFWPNDRGLKNTLFIGTGEDLPENDVKTEKRSREVDKVNFLDGATAYKIVENGNE